MITLLAALSALYLLLTLLVAIVLRLVLRGRNCISWARDEIRAGRAVAVVIRRSRHKPYPFYGLYRPLRPLVRQAFHIGVIRRHADNPMHHLTPTDDEHATYWAQGQWAALRSLWHFRGHVQEGNDVDD